MPITESTINTLKFAEEFSSNLDKVIVRESVVGFLLDNNFRTKFMGARTVRMPDISMVGLANYSRDEGFVRGGITVGQQDFTLSMDRGRQLIMDREDLDETGIANLSAEIMKEFVRTEVTPEIDSYTLSKLAQVALGEDHAYTVGGEGSYYADLMKCVSAIREKIGYKEELVALADGTFYNGLMSGVEEGKTIDIGNFKSGEIDTQVNRVNGVPIIPAPSEWMKSAFEATNDGLKVDSGAKSVHLIVMPKKAASLVKKTETMRIFTPAQNKDADAYIFNYRVYYDVFVKKSNLGTIHAVFNELPV
jgi:hypothetical protein